MNLKRYIRFRVRRIIDAAEVPADLVSNREMLLDKMLKLWYKWKKSVERETKALVADFKKTEKAKKVPPKTLLSKADKLYKSIHPVCLAYAKVNQKLQSGNPTSAEMSKIGLSGKVVPIPRGVKGDNLLRSINRNKIPAEDFDGFEISGMKQELESALAPYYNVATKTLSTKLAAESEEEKLAKPQMTPKAPIMAKPKESKSNTASTLNKLYSDLKAAADAAWKLSYQEVKKVKPSGYERLKAKALRLMAPFKDIINSSSSLSFHVNGGSDGIHTPEYSWSDFNNFMLKTYGVNLDTSSDDKEYKVLSNIRKLIQALARYVGDVVYFMNLYAADNAKQGNSQPKPSTSGGSTSSSKSLNNTPSAKEPQVSASEISEGKHLLDDLEFSARYAKEFAEEAYERSKYHNLSWAESSAAHAEEASGHMIHVLKILPQRGRFSYTPAISSSELLDGLAKKMGVSIEKAKAIFTSGKNAQLFKSTLSKINSAREWMETIDKMDLIP